MDYVDETRCIGVAGEEKASGLDGSALGGHAGELELLVALLVVLGEAGFRVHTTKGL